MWTYSIGHFEFLQQDYINSHIKMNYVQVIVKSWWEKKQNMLESIQIGLLIKCPY